jgi:hypothetical protein
MSKNEEFEHGTGHKFSVTKVHAGEYRSCCGHKISSRSNHRDYGGGTVWDIYQPSRNMPDDVENTLRDAKKAVSYDHNPKKESNDWPLY